jgi:hypothetical protein
MGRPDAITGMYDLGVGYRWYSTAMMRLLNPDSISPFGEDSKRRRKNEYFEYNSQIIIPKKHN